MTKTKNKKKTPICASLWSITSRSLVLNDKNNTISHLLFDQAITVLLYMKKRTRNTKRVAKEIVRVPAEAGAGGHVPAAHLVQIPVLQ